MNPENIGTNSRDLSAGRLLLRHLFDTAVAAADPMLRIPCVLPPKPPGRVVLVGAGKASARMAEAVVSTWGPCEGVVLTRDGYSRPVLGVDIVEASHPVPDSRGYAGTARVLRLLSDCGEDDFVVALISGGGSALLARPAGEITLHQEQEMTRALLASGAPIEAMNLIRKHLSTAKGGALAAATHPARMLSLIISDVPGDDLESVACGPTVGDTTCALKAREMLGRWSIPVTTEMAAVLDGPRVTFAPEAPELSRVENLLIATPMQSLHAAKLEAEAHGIRVIVLGDAIEGEARDVAFEHAQIAKRVRSDMHAGEPPVLLLSGGECTVTQRGGGVGGPNAEYALALSIALDDSQGISAIACDTDGVDGAAEVAGAIIDSTTLFRAYRAQLSPLEALERQDSHSFFSILGDQIITGPTYTNVNDFRAILVSK